MAPVTFMITPEEDKQGVGTAVDVITALVIISLVIILVLHFPKAFANRSRILRKLALTSSLRSSSLHTQSSVELHGIRPTPGSTLAAHNEHLVVPPGAVVHAPHRVATLPTYDPNDPYPSHVYEIASPRGIPDVESIESPYAPDNLSFCFREAGGIDIASARSSVQRPANAPPNLASSKGHLDLHNNP